MKIIRTASQSAPVHCGLVACVASTLATLAGCSGDPLPIAPVTGTVTLDGAPLDGAWIEFQPFDRKGSPSYASTDAAGKYDLAFSQTRRGAWVGEHLVRISTRNENERIPERLPPQYHVDSDVKRQVEANGENVFNFDIILKATSEPSQSEPN